jgi:glycosidase
VFYEVFVRSFADSDGDGIGDLRGVIDRLDELQALGVDALWLMPVAESPSYHGYDVTDYEAIEPDYGSLEDMRDLMVAVDARNMHVIVDLVMNHTSIEHPWFQDARTPGSEHDDWYVWSDSPPAFAGPGGRPVWHPDGDRWYYGYFWEGMPDLNVTNPAVSVALDEVARFWLDDVGVDGFRLDAARHLIEDGSTLENTDATFDWLRGFNERIPADDLVLGEVWDATSMASRYVREGALDLTFDFDLAAQFLGAVRSGDAASLRYTQGAVGEAYAGADYAAFLTNHDQDRTFDVVDRDVAKAKQAATLLLTDPGIPFLYYGEEVGLRGRKPDERIRTPMPWTGEAPGYGFTTGEPWQPMADDVATANVAAQVDDPDSLWSHYQALIALRRSVPALAARVPITPIEASDDAVLATLRHDPATGTAAVVVSNLGDEALPDVKLELAEGPLCGAPTAAAAFSTAGAPAPTVAAPAVTPTGGLADWSLGAMAPHQDLVITLTP